MSDAAVSTKEESSLSSLLQQVMEISEAGTGMRANFDDLTGVRYDIPAMHIDEDHEHHVCPFCLVAKTDPGSRNDCIRNKIAANWIVIRRKAGLEGICHMGLFDLVEPLVIQGRVLGAFYYGSVLIRGTEEESLKRIRAYCAANDLDPGPYEKALKEVPVIDPGSIPRHRESLKTIVRLARFLCESAGVKPELYKIKPLKLPYLSAQDLPYVIKESMRYIYNHVNEPFIVKDLAAHLRCHPDFLSRKFKHYAGVDLSLYLRQVRIEHAKELLQNPKVRIDDAAEQSGFSDRITFTKVFRRMTGQTPGQYQRQFDRSEEGPDPHNVGVAIREGIYLPSKGKKNAGPKEAERRRLSS